MGEDYQATCFILMILPNTSTTAGHTTLLLQCWPCWASSLGLQSVTCPYMEWVCSYVLIGVAAVDNTCNYAVESVHTHLLYVGVSVLHWEQASPKQFACTQNRGQTKLLHRESPLTLHVNWCPEVKYMQALLIYVLAKPEKPLYLHSRVDTPIVSLTEQSQTRSVIVSFNSRNISQ